MITVRAAQLEDSERIAALAQPSLQSEERRPLSDIVLLVVDQSASQNIADRAAQTDMAVRRVEAEVAALP